MKTERFQIEGGRRLEGEVTAHGAKNSVLPLLAATIAGNGVSVLDNCPELSDVDASLRILTHLGCRVIREGARITVDSRTLCRYDIPDRLMREMRSSVIFMGAILSRSGRVEMSAPGGCELGARPIDLHLHGIARLGARVSSDGGAISCRAGDMNGAVVSLKFPSVGATENIMLAACACKGETTIVNAAREPEICELQAFMRAMGARVSGAGGSVIKIQGGCELKGAEHRVMPDRIVTATFFAAAAATGGDIFVRQAQPEPVEAVSQVLREAGCEIFPQDGGLRVIAPRRLRAVKPVVTQPYPGFPTDAQAPVMAALLQAEGTTAFVENIFESRYRHVPELLRFGADIRTEGKTALVCGVSQLHGASVEASELRGAAALTIAALSAEGQSVVSGLRHLDRGYDGLERQLGLLGARIYREQICACEAK